MNFGNMGAADGEDTRHRPPSTPHLPLDRQLSVYSLTFDEFQSTLGGPGKDYGSMNMDELLRNIWTAEETQAMASAFGGPSSSSAAPNPVSGPTSASAAAAALQRQGSLTLPRTLSQKTVDEVWRDLLRESELPQLQQQQQQPQRQPTLGEMTLEEFLVRAGVVREEIPQQPVVPVPTPVIRNNNHSTNANNSFFGELPNSNSNNFGLGFSRSTRPANTTPAMVLPYPAPIDLGNQPGMRGGMGDPGMGNSLVSGILGLGGGCAVGSPDGLGKGNRDLSSLSPVPFSFGAGLSGRKSGAVEKVVERRQRRMIKNRESAARSRERKQAYTMELEADVAKLKEQNEKLQKKQEEIMEIQKIQVMEMINQQPGPKKMCLRRIQTGPW